MMARKLSRIVRGIAMFIVAADWTTSTPQAIAQSEMQVTSPGSTMVNPFTVVGAKPRAVLPELTDSHRGPTTYQNPFAATAKAPPIDNSVRPGPTSRWRRPTIPQGGSSNGTSSALLMPESLQAGPAGAAKTPANSDLLGNIGTDPIIRSTPNALAQPGSIDARPSTKNRLSVIAGPDEGSSTTTIPDPAAFISDHALTPPVIKFGSTPTAKDEEHADIAAVLGNCDDTPEGWLEQAQDAAKTAASLEQLSTVITLCDRGLQRTPSSELLGSLRRLSAWAHNRRGELLADTQHGDDAAQDFQAAISLDPNCSLAIHNRAVTLAQRNQYGAALRDFNRVIELNPGLAVAYRNRAELLAALGRMDEAIADYSQAIASLPDDASLLCARARAYQRVGNFADAAADISSAIHLMPQDPDIITQRGNLAAEQGRFEKAREDFEQALAIDANWAEALRSLAWLQATCPDNRFRDAAKALETAEHAAKIVPEDDYRILDTLAAANACGSHFDQAVRLQQKAVAAAPRDLSTPLEQRLALYQRGKPYVAASVHGGVRTASHEEAAATPRLPKAAPPASRR